MEINIRRAEASDALSLSDLYKEFINADSNIMLMQDQIERISSNNNYCVAVACIGNEVVGTAMGIVCYDLVGNCNSYLLIENVVISKEHRGKGIGKLLMIYVEEFGRDNMCNYAFLVSGNNQVESHKFYESIGYTGSAMGFRKRFWSQI